MLRRIVIAAAMTLLALRGIGAAQSITMSSLPADTVQGTPMTATVQVVPASGVPFSNYNIEVGLTGINTAYNTYACFTPSSTFTNVSIPTTTLPADTYTVNDVLWKLRSVGGPCLTGTIVAQDPQYPNITFNNCGAIPPSSSLTDAFGNVYTLDASGNVLVNGKSDAGGSSVNLLVYDSASGFIWARSGTIWFYQSGANVNWTTNGTTGPQCGSGVSSTPTPMPSPSSSATPMPTPTPTNAACRTPGLCASAGNYVYAIDAPRQPCIEGTDCVNSGDCCLYAVAGDNTSQCVECNASNRAALETFNEKLLSAQYCATRHGVNGCP